ncbi:MAG: hypothetical protein A2341_23375 [Deltaproteobacteria bacterium RIFOXYB12_FULL_58_9]|nr:MAG: hypothetical protein A2341_23375 [Deltaproteobacteria bacterium RIFOXYB12_FULL_58_9]
MTELFARPKPSRDCLSAWQISRFALGDVAERERAVFQEHLGRCEHCAARVQEEVRLVDAAKYERIPGELLATHTPSSKTNLLWLWKPAGAMVAVGFAAVFLVALPQREDSGTRMKGDIGISLTVMRDGSTLFNDTPVEQIQSLRPGDQLRLRVHGPSDTWVVVQGWEKSTWVEYYVGAISTDRWLPIGVEVTSERETRLKVFLCTGVSDKYMAGRFTSEGKCQERELEL